MRGSVGLGNPLSADLPGLVLSKKGLRDLAQNAQRVADPRPVRHRGLQQLPWDADRYTYQRRPRRREPPEPSFVG